MGLLAGQLFHTWGIPVPIPLVGNLRVYNYSVQKLYNWTNKIKIKNKNAGGMKVQGKGGEGE